MAARRAPSLCLARQARQAVVGRRRPRSSPIRNSHVTTISALHDEYLPDSGGREGQLGFSSGQNGGQPAEAHDSTRSAVHEAAASLMELWKSRDTRLRVLRTLSNPVPPAPKGRTSAASNQSIQLPEAGAAVVSHAQFREELRSANYPKRARSVLSRQLLRCEWPRDFLRIVAAAVQNREHAIGLAALDEQMMRAMYRCRKNVSDAEVLRTLTIVITRFRWADIEVKPRLVFMALKFAARARSLGGMKRFLGMVREQNISITSHVFRSIIAKFSIGHRGLGEIRNGRWKRHELAQVLTGFNDLKHLPPEQQCHLGTFMIREDWPYLHGWVAALARCKEAEAVWQEWLAWQHSPARLQPRQLIHSEGQVTSKVRGDYWFVEQMAYTDDITRAWEILQCTRIFFSDLKPRVQDMFLGAPELVPEWTDEIRRAMMIKYDRDLALIEEALGVKWVREDAEGTGHHELMEDQEEALDRLGSPNWQPRDSHGIPDADDAPIVSAIEAPLHLAQEASTCGPSSYPQK